MMHAPMSGQKWLPASAVVGLVVPSVMSWLARMKKWTLQAKEVPEVLYNVIVKLGFTLSKKQVSRIDKSLQVAVVLVVMKT